MRILALDSSGLVASVALMDDEVLLGEYSTNMHRTHSTTLLPMLDELMRMCQLSVKKAGIDAIAVAKGPGSFTGLRIGAATAKGLALTLNVPIIPVSTLMGLCYNLWGVEGTICPLMDARRHQVYTAGYRFHTQTSDENDRESVSLETLAEPCAVDVSEIIDRVNDWGGRVTFLGDGVPVYQDDIRAGCHIPFRIAPASMNRQRAASVGFCAIRMVEEDSGCMIQSDKFAPEYLRLSQAERERLEQEQG